MAGWYDEPASGPSYRSRACVSGRTLLREYRVTDLREHSATIMRFLGAPAGCPGENSGSLWGQRPKLAVYRLLPLSVFGVAVLLKSVVHKDICFERLKAVVSEILGDSD